MNKKADITDDWEAEDLPVQKKMSEEEQKLVIDHQELIWAITREYRSRLHDLTQRELHQIGNLGAIEAAKRFNAAKGYKFSTYAAWWIRSMLRKCIAREGRTIQWPTHIYEKRQKLGVCRKEADANRDEAQIANERGLSDIVIRNTRRALNMGTISMSRIIKTKNEVDPLRLEDTIGDKGKHCPERSYLWKEFRTILKKLRSEDFEAYEVLRLAFGLDSGEEMPLSEISRTISLTPEAVKKIKSRGLKKLRKLY